MDTFGFMSTLAVVGDPPPPNAYYSRDITYTVDCKG
jgi:hypothetical protein